MCICAVEWYQSDLICAVYRTAEQNQFSASMQSNSRSKKQQQSILIYVTLWTSGTPPNLCGAQQPADGV